jgi:transposase
MRLFAGIDWGGAKHAACVVDETGKILAHFDVGHDALGLAELVKQLSKYAKDTPLQVSIERPSGLLVDTLVEAGFLVVPIHPNVVKASRSRYRAACSKDDRGDAYLLADVLRTDGHRLRALQPQSDELKALRALVRTRDDLVRERVAVANQLRALLESFWPGATQVFCEIDSPISLAFITRYPTPLSASTLTEKRLARFLAQRAYPGRRSPKELLERMRSAAIGAAGPLEAAAKGDVVRTLTAVLDALVDNIAKLSRRIEHDVAQLAVGKIVMSFPRAGKISAAQIVSELGDQRDRFATSDQLAAEAGVAPVTRASGKQRSVVFRFACNHRLRTAITTFADNSRHESDWAALVYRKARQRGCDHPHAIRLLARAWLRVLWRAWITATPYDSALHRAAVRLTAAVA